ncbi:MAG: universal stress protein [Myxococcales bacterium]|nr:universal stress protein [Myxococcales bacterium]
MTDKQADRPYTIVVGVELDETGVNALKRAIALAGHTGGEVHLCYTTKSSTDDSEKIAKLLDETLEKLTGWLRMVVDKGDLPEQTILHPGLGDPAKVLEQLAVDHDANVIIVGTHQQSAMRRLMKGSVAHTLLNEAPCPVMVAIPPHYEGLEKSPQIEPARPDAVGSHIAHPHAYHYRRSIHFSNVVGTINPSGIPSRGF